ncbi:MAG: Sua5/YciO/YrdC/YwlC family protein [Coriobacteriales bacterium]|jgi:L-threonylcarbamoyladenylate synthase|nr:Sua5/YciO/YrdC/YwlC family protein [Coriobacteriales bacterium]
MSQLSFSGSGLGSGSSSSSGSQPPQQFSDQLTNTEEQPIKAKLVDLPEAVSLLNAGRVLLVPTDTVWGLALKVDPLSDPETLYELKGRDADKAIPWLVGSVFDLEFYASELPSWAKPLAERYWPGPLTIVCQAGDLAPKSFVAKDGSLALRMPRQRQTLELMGQLGAPLATTSANRQGQPASSQLADLDPELLTEVGVVFAGGEMSGEAPGGEVSGCGASKRDTSSGGASCPGAETPSNLPSTIVSCLSDQPQILRVGALAASDVLVCIEKFGR